MTMGMYKRFIENYLEQLLPLCSEEQFGQDAIEWAIFSGHVAITHDLQTDLRHIMGLPGHPETGEYDNICDLCGAPHKSHNVKCSKMLS